MLNQHKHLMMIIILNNLVLLFNVLKPLPFKVQKIDVLLFNVVQPERFSGDNTVVLLIHVANPDTFKAVICNDEKAVEPFILVVVLFKLLIDNIELVDKLFIL